MSNLIDSRKILVFKHLNRCLLQYERAANVALQTLRNEALFGIAMDSRMSMEDYDAVRVCIDGYIRQRRATDSVAAVNIRRDLHLAHTHRLPAPIRPYHLRHIKRYPRWSKE